MRFVVLVGLFRRFVSDRGASMATQVVMFSVVLFGMSGVVLDFGRVYSEHSRMQAFTDQAALAAASELDGTPDALERAIDAVFLADGSAVVGKDGLFSSADGALAYNISHLYFVRTLSEETGAQYDLGDDLKGGNLVFMATPTSLGDPESLEMQAASTQARYVVAVGQERSVRNSLLQFVNATGAARIGADQKVRTISAARARRVTCGSVSNLVMCNPWENDPLQSFQSVIGDDVNLGMHIMLTADGSLPTASTPVDTGTTDFYPRNGLSRLARRADGDMVGTGPVMTICNGDVSLLPGYHGAMSPDEIAHARVVCMLAAAEQDDDACVPEVIPIVGATPAEVTTALSTAFDMWDEPIAGVLDWDRDGDGNHSQHPDFNIGTAHPNRDLSAHFQPDPNIYKARLWRSDIAAANAGSRPEASRRNFPPILGVTNRFVRMLTRCVHPVPPARGTECAVDSNNDEIDWVSIPIRPSQVEEYWRLNFQKHIDANFADQVFTGNFDVFDPDFSVYSNHALARPLELAEWQQAHREYGFGTVPEGTPFNASGEDGTLAPPPTVTELRPCIDQDGLYADCDGDGQTYDDGSAYTGVTDPDDLLTNLPTSDPRFEEQFTRYTYSHNDIDRRFMDVIVVNCQSTRTSASGEVMAEVVGVTSMYLLMPPTPICLDGSEDCDNADLDRAIVYGELQGLSATNPQSYAVLVR